MPRTRIMLNGIRDAKTAEAAETAGVDAVGFDFRPGSPRHIDPYAASDILAALPPLVSAVAIYADPTLDDFLDAEAVCPAPFTQLAGDEKDNLVRRIGPDVLKSVALDHADLDGQLRHWSDIEEVCAVVLQAPGGFDWAEPPPALARSITLTPMRVVLSGGLNASNVGHATRTCRPWGVALSLEDNESQGIAEFCEAVRRADATE
ncbi:MAG: hypothetical protein AAFV77_06280 [Planctomycetota bacterium]